MPMPSEFRVQMVWFDMGNVLLHFSRAGQAAALSALPGCRRSVEEIVPFIDGRSAEHLAYERGQIDRQSFLASLTAFLDTSAAADEVDDAYSTLFTRNSPVCRLAAELARVIPIGLATNTDQSHLRRARRDYPETMSLFSAKHTVASCDCGHRKPSGEFFQCLVAQAERPASTLCFVDDLPTNVAAARQAGIGDAFQYRGFSSLRNDLARLGIPIDDSHT